MKGRRIAIGARLQSGPFGGGNQFIGNLVRYLREAGDEVFFDLDTPGLDIVLLSEPRKNLRSCAFSEVDILRKLWKKSPQAIVLHRINECDERKGTNGLNRRLIWANAIADHTIYVSAWLRDLYLSQGLSARTASVILNGSDKALFHARGHRPWAGQGPIKMVTHHWGGHPNKGFDIYSRFDALLDLPQWGKRFSLTYIGNLPSSVRFRNIRHIAPLHGEELADALRQHHAYLTASINEPGSNHQNEGALCGLPLLYRDSGGLPEYCEGFGISFNEDNFEAGLEQLHAQYGELHAQMPGYPHDSQGACQAYDVLFQRLLQERKSIITARSCRPFWRLRTLLGLIPAYKE